MHKKIDVIEQPVKIDMVVQPVDTEIQEPTVDVAVLVDDQDIEVEDVHIVDIEMTEAFPFMTNGALNEHMHDKDVLMDGGVAIDKNDEYVLLQDLLEISAGSGAVSHPDLHGREFSNQHPISAIENLQKNLDDLGATERVYSSSNGLGEFRQWKDGNPSGEDRSGYFVAIVPGTDEIEICDATHDVYGISVHNSGFIGNQDDLYYKGKDLLNNNANNPSYAVVGIVGAMRVRTDGTARNGDYVVPNAYGEATLSENDYGYKVLSQGSYPSYNYVTIAITPQSDALSRLQSSVAGGDLGEILIKIENIDKGIGDLELKVDASAGDIEDILSEIGGLQQRVTTAEEVVKDAVTNAEEAKDVATQAASKAAQAQQDAQDAAAGAISTANQALSELSTLAGQMEPIVSWQSADGLSSGAGGFVSQANDDHTLLASIVYGSGPEGSSLAAIMQKVDENGAMIQHLVSHVDRYVVGENSLSDGLTHDEAKSILTEEYIYVPTSDHEETMTGEPNVVTNFKRGYYYIWDVSDGVWVESATQVSMATTYNDGSDEGDLWYCWQDVIVDDDAYVAGTLYRWFGSEWVAVTTIADNRNARVLTSIRQEADSIQSDVVNLRGDVSSIEQNVDGITTRVGEAEGNISSITQEVGNIQSNISTIDGAVSSLQQHATNTDASLTAIALGRFPTIYNAFTDTVPPTSYDEKKYTHPPVWDDVAKEFVFNDTYLSGDGTYYFFAEDKTKYCHAIDDTNYELWTISKEITAMLDSRIDENQANIRTLVEFKTETQEKVGNLEGTVKTNTESIANVSSLANKNEASITSLTNRYYHILLSVSEEEVPAYGDKYEEAPEWDAASGKYKFTTIARGDGVYYMVDESCQVYCKVVTLEDGTVLYETYGLANSSLAAIEQKVEENSSSIGLVVENTKNVIDENGNLKDDAISGKGSIILQVINDESNAQIKADRIALTATDKITSLVTKTVADSKEVFIEDAGKQTDEKLKDYLTTDEATELANKTKEDAVTEASENADEKLKDYATNKALKEYVTTESFARIKQQVEGNKSSIELVAGHIEKVIDEDGNLKDESISSKGSIIIGAINNESIAQIKADRIELTATDSITLAVSKAKQDAVTQANSDTDGKLKDYAKIDKVSQIEQKVTANSSSIDLVVQDGKASGKLMMEAINNDTSSVTISANKIQLEGTDSISLAVSNAVTQANNATDNKLKNYATTSAITPASIVAAINESGSEVIINANKINLSGYVTISDLSTAGSTTISGSNITTGTIAANYISLYGMTITNQSTQQTSFAVSPTGAVTINGNVTMGAGSSINWDTVSTTGDDITKNPLSQATLARWDASNAVTAVQNIVNGTYLGGTFINQNNIYSPNIYANQLTVLSKETSYMSRNTSGGLFIKGWVNSIDTVQREVFKIGYDLSISPYISFTSECGAYANWNFSVTNVAGYYHFNDAINPTVFATHPVVSTVYGDYPVLTAYNFSSQVTSAQCTAVFGS